MGGHEFEPGDVFAGYRVDRCLGAGGVGEVYLVLHPRLAKHFALKVLIPDRARDPQFAARFTREMRTVSALDDHPNIVASTDGGITDGRVWLVMQYVEGGDAVHALAAAPSGLPVADVVRISESVGSALDYAHHRGFIHRDVKPGNILIRNDGHVFLTDFGIARAIVDPHPITTDGVPLTWAYASPEQIDRHDLDGRSDQYSLACTVHTLLTGRTPFQDVPLSARAANDPPRPSHVNPRLPPGIDGVVAKAMATDPTGRFKDCASFARALREATEPAVTVGPGGTVGRSMAQPYPTRTVAGTRVEPVPPAPRRRRQLVIGGIAVLAVAVVAVTWLSLTRVGSTVAPTSITTSSAGASPVAQGGSDATAITTSAGAAPAAVVTLADVLDPPLPAGSGRSADQPIAGAPTINLGPRNCANGSQRLTVDVGSGLERITGTFLMSDDADADTHTQVTVITDGAPGEPQMITPRSGVTIDSRVDGATAVAIELVTAGSGRCGTDDYEVFLTNAQAFR